MHASPEKGTGYQASTSLKSSLPVPEVLARSRDDQEYNYKAVARWTRPKRLQTCGQECASILDCDRIIAPVHLGMHWTCAMADLANQEFAYFDSMGVSCCPLLCCRIFCMGKCNLHLLKPCQRELSYFASTCHVFVDLSLTGLVQRSSPCEHCPHATSPAALSPQECELSFACDREGAKR